MTNPYEMVLGIIVVVVLGRIIQTRLRTVSNGRRDVVAEDMATLAQEVSQLKARIQVLERVITDNHSSAELVSEIERLRDR